MYPNQHPHDNQHPQTFKNDNLDQEQHPPPSSLSTIMYDHKPENPSNTGWSTSSDHHPPVVDRHGSSSHQYPQVTAPVTPVINLPPPTGSATQIPSMSGDKSYNPQGQSIPAMPLSDSMSPQTYVTSADKQSYAQVPTEQAQDHSQQSSCQQSPRPTPTASPASTSSYPYSTGNVTLPASHSDASYPSSSTQQLPSHLSSVAQSTDENTIDANEIVSQNPGLTLSSLTLENPPEGITPKITTTLWEDEGTLCFQVEVKGICVARREDNNMINGTKLLNIAGMSRGRRDGILKAEKNRHVVKVGAMHFKGVWIPYDRAVTFAHKEKIIDLLYPLFIADIKALLYHPNNYARTALIMSAAIRKREENQQKQRERQEMLRRKQQEDEQQAVQMQAHVRMGGMPMAGPSYYNPGYPAGIIDPYRQQAPIPQPGYIFTAPPTANMAPVKPMMPSPLHQQQQHPLPQPQQQSPIHPPPSYPNYYYQSGPAPGIAGPNQFGSIIQSSPTGSLPLVSSNPARPPSNHPSPYQQPHQQFIRYRNQLPSGSEEFSPQSPNNANDPNATASGSINTTSLYQLQYLPAASASSPHSQTMVPSLGNANINMTSPMGILPTPTASLSQHHPQGMMTAAHIHGQPSGYVSQSGDHDAAVPQSTRPPQYPSSTAY